MTSKPRTWTITNIGLLIVAGPQTEPIQVVHIDDYQEMTRWRDECKKWNQILSPKVMQLEAENARLRDDHRRLESRAYAFELEKNHLRRRVKLLEASHRMSEVGAENARLRSALLALKHFNNHTIEEEIWRIDQALASQEPEGEGPLWVQWMRDGDET